MAETTEPSIRFVAEEVRATLAKRKSQFRRVIKPQPDISLLKPGIVLKAHKCPVLGPSHHGKREWGLYAEPFDPRSVPAFAYDCPYGQVGMKLWVRETWAEVELDDVQGDVIFWKATDAAREISPGITLAKWRPSIHMPRWASRILLEITGIRMERVQSISGEDCIAEGCKSWNATYLDLHSPIRTPGDHLYGPQGRTPEERREFVTANLRIEYRAHWDSLNAKRGYGWGVNPWVWVIKFKQLFGNGP